DDLSYEHEFDARYWTIEQFIPEHGTKQLFKDNEINIYGYQNLREFDSGLIVRPFYDKILLFASLYPDIYIFNVTADKIQPVWQRNDARSNAILIGDFDDNGVDEFYYNDGSYIRGFTLPVQNRPDRPGLISANPLDSIRALISWSPVSGVNGYRVYRGADRFDLQPLRITGNTGVIDSSLNVEQKYYFAVSAIDSSFEVYESLKSSVDSVRTSLPPRLISARAVNDRQAVLTFNEDIKISDEKKFSAYLVPSGHFNTSAVVLNDRKTILAGFSGHFNETVMDTVVVSNIFDTQGVPVDKSFDRIMLNYTVQYPEPYIQSRKVLDRKTIELTFSEPMLRGDLLNTENFRFYPAGEAEAIQLVDSVNTVIHVQVSENSRIGALGFETYLILQNMHSEKGVLLNESKKIYLNEEISDLHNTIIYPQPVKPQHNLLTFAGLPENVSIYIFDMNGRLVKTIKESTYYGGIQWDLKDENDRPVHSGVYLYRIVHSGEEKLGKLVIVR
ncbi:MAG: T9SS type A sorting domain-containing protein, partial [Calditrichaceae bacterium]